MDDALRTVGLARKAGAVEAGEEPCGAAARAKKAKVILLASDAADNTVRRAEHFAEQGNCPLLHTPYDKDSLGAVIGRTGCAMLAVTDIGLASLLASALEREDPGKYGEAARQLREKEQRARQRRQEKRQHQKNVKQGKKKK